MRLSKIKLAGFKSFVDPTTISLPSNLVGVVGPNGCGKSNTIDAVRWVMGESSAKHLRGDSMEDVIFSGSTSRKPVGQASVELVFDNSDGSVGGEYASYAEISVRRQVSREGQSIYYLNGSRCRRRDITDIFLGTGLGPRSYAIIEQGMIARLIEAKPEEMRVYIEEAAGISKYKDRRRETENRIRHTRDNLDRLNDVREEVEKQIAHLKRQARTAERFKELKSEERRTKAELLALRRVAHSDALAAREQDLQEKATQLEKCVADQRAAESVIEKQRDAHSGANERFNGVQGTFYKLGADISRSEQTIQHNKETHQRQQLELKQVQQTWNDNNQLIAQDREKIRQLSESIDDDTPTYERLLDEQKDSAEVLAQAERAMTEWQGNWDNYNRRNAEPLQIAQVERSRIEQFERLIQQVSQRAIAQQNALATIDSGDLGVQIALLVDEESSARHAEEQAKVALLEDTQALAGLREKQVICQRSLDRARAQTQTTHGRLASLEALQQASLGEHDGRASEWLAQNGLSNCTRLAQHLNVESGWELAVETVLEGYLEAVCVDQLPTDLAGFSEGQLTFLDTQSGVPSASHSSALLVDKINSTVQLPGLLSSVYAADSYRQALSMRATLGAAESVVSADGIWLGANWLRVNRTQGEDASILVREQAIKALRETLERQQNQVSEQEMDNAQIADQLHAIEQRRDQSQAAVNATHRLLVEAQSKHNALRVKQEQIQQNQARLHQELSDLEEQREQYRSECEVSSERRARALEQVEVLAVEGDTLSALRDTLRSQLERARQQSQQQNERGQQIAIRVESMRTARTATEQNLARVESQLKALETRRDTLLAAQQEGDEPIKAKEAELETLLAERLQVEKRLTETRAVVDAIEADLRLQEQHRTQAEQAAQKVREQLEADRLASQEVRVRIQTLDEQLQETGLEYEALLADLPEEASPAIWNDKLAAVESRIQRLGPINLAAIEEHAEQENRKEYLDKQFADVTEALATLESAIEKIDRETRSRFKETFEKVNGKLQGYFPRLFGGGHANLIMTGNDLLDTGVSVMARPPGKRVSNIHLLSGGEKALTAVALVFAFFELNPAPFCMLDEVDAPLDDANVGRYCELVREMSERVQFIFITHNKNTMELSQHLMGVTMHEPGVSRLVSVDVAEAARLAQA